MEEGFVSSEMGAPEREPIVRMEGPNGVFWSFHSGKFA